MYCVKLDRALYSINYDNTHTLRRIKAWDMQFCVNNMVILNSLYLEKSLRYVYQPWSFDCWYVNLI